MTAQLIRADNGYRLWSQTYDRNLKDVFQIQDEIATAVVAALKVHLLPSQQLSSAHRTENTEAYNQYLLGRQFADRETLDDWRRAIKAYRKAIELEPDFAAAYAGLSIAEFHRAPDQQCGRNAPVVADRAGELARTWAGWQTQVSGTLGGDEVAVLVREA